MDEGTVVLILPELQAIDTIVAADVEQLRGALRRLPQYQRQSLRWLARELGDLSPTRAETPRALVHQRARRQAILTRHELEGAIDTLGEATPQERALLKQHVGHLWQYFEQALQQDGSRRQARG